MLKIVQIRNVKKKPKPGPAKKPTDGKKKKTRRERKTHANGPRPTTVHHASGAQSLPLNAENRDCR